MASYSEQKQSVAARMSSYRDKFVVDAVEAGFSQKQAEFMAQHLSMVGHVHEIDDGSLWLTRPEVR